MTTTDQKTVLDALQAVMEVIEATYDHDEHGNRLDQSGQASAADIVEMLCNVERHVADALATMRQPAVRE